MWSKSFSVTTQQVTKEQMWQLFENVNQWHTWDEGIEYAQMDGRFEKGNHFILKPKNAPKVKIQLVEAIRNQKFTDLTNFPLAKMWGEHTLEDTPQGLKITTTMRVKGILSFLWIKIVAQDIVNNLPSDTEAQIKAASQL